MKPYITPATLATVIAQKGEPVAEPLPKATIVKQFEKMEVLSPVVVYPSGKERRRQRRAMERKLKRR